MAKQTEEHGRAVWDMCERDCDLMEAGAIALEEALKGSAELRARIGQLEKEAETLKSLARKEIAICRDAEIRANNAESELSAAKTKNHLLTAENAGLREDKARLDWLEASPTQMIVVDGSEDTLRSAIDAARGAK